MLTLALATAVPHVDALLPAARALVGVGLDRLGAAGAHSHWYARDDEALGPLRR